MNQSTLIFGGVVFAFIVYVTIKGELPTYISYFTTPGMHGNPTAANSNPSQGGGSSGGGLDFGKLALAGGEAALNSFVPGAGTALDIGASLLGGFFG